MDFSQINEQLPIERFQHPVATENQIDLRILRLDKTHGEISGNKWFKLKYNLLEARNRGINKLLTFGGAYSNHIYAVAAAAKLFGFQSVGIIRGEEHIPLNPTLQFATDAGMHLHYVDRESYRNKTVEHFINQLRAEFGEFYLIPEGGTNRLAIQGAAEIPSLIPEPFDYYCLAVGTGGTIAGLISGMKGQGNIIGFSSLKGSFLQDEVANLLQSFGHESLHNWSIQNEYHFGGYAKTKPNLIEFIKAMEEQFELELEPIYMGKMLYGILDMIEKGQFEKGSKILAVHTGGLQGRAGFGL
ncbi:1-aminocyclopropane-1-carboxylate deaminase [Roseivirga spongicola]|uniref:1-aminocyclopropane-1-carboxylate deaminase n=1 Tax=Roseivirga spongicola TaxID=333140 RepID=A0A150XH63_9BACT|nr:pyridoxal-phosphate dependent enzyme [Roseivirga spongicola]KYG78038.1 1-aminocyclopropane-1-carboxylate deaminase [Roseivirga spongicola]